MRHVLIAVLALSLAATAAAAQTPAAAKRLAGAPVTTASADAEKNKAQLLTEQRQRAWDRKAASSMKSICSNC